MRAIAKTTLKDHPDLDRRQLVAVARALWNRPVFERRAVAVELLDLHGKMLAAGDLPFVEALIRDSRTWALVDPLSVNIAGELVERHGELNERLDRWADDDDFWVRRAALLALLRPLRRGGGDFARFGSYADAMLEEKEFFIRKAIGWVLRETSKKRPDLVYTWLAPRASRASGVTVREAVKYLPERRRAEVLSLYGRTRMGG
jgi:3-methyladenine DNA glycosylase AlkD